MKILEMNENHRKFSEGVSTKLSHILATINHKLKKFVPYQSSFYLICDRQIILSKYSYILMKTSEMREKL